MLFNFKEGNTPIILVSTHGGLRRRGFTITNHKSADKNVNKTLFSIERALNKKKVKPFIILSKIHRSIVDLNRPHKRAQKAEAAEIWTIFHRKLESYIKNCLRKYGKCFIFDLHGHKRNKEIHLGYGMNNADIRTKQWHKSSVTPIAHKFNIDPKKLIYGTHSLCDMLERKGLHCIPSDHRPTDLSRYLNGGFITRHYSKKYSSYPIAVIQIELPAVMRQQDTIYESGNVLANTINTFVRQSLFRKRNRKKLTKKKKLRKRRRRTARIN